MGSLVGIIGVLALFGFVPGIPGYVIAQRRGLSNPWVAFVPLVGLWIVLCESVGENGWIGLVALIPLFGLALAISLAVKVPGAHGRSRWWSLALIVPVLNILGYWVYAFTLPRGPRVQLVDAVG